ncbi:expansin family protein [Rhodotorula toruloides]|uniref:Expansin family protein n=1 Tax=Rhodotorula toruloides TaxID=5286 RepID=A0A511KI81_RHOTO|nr:expansin family protein [Rhodotorula toruloides]
MHLPVPTLLVLTSALLLSTSPALARPFPSAFSLSLEDTAGSWRLPPSFLFPPPPLNSTEKDKRNVVKNPKVVLNPKNPWFSTSVREAAAAQTTTTRASLGTVWVPAPPPTTTTTMAAATSVKATTTTREAVQTTTSQPAQTTSPPSSSTSQAASSTTSSAPVAQFTGRATYFYQYGAAGACGNYNPDTASIVALDSRLYGNMGQRSQYCGRALTITNTANGKSVVATVADACPGCSSMYSLDLSLGAFEAIGELDTGVLPIVWHWNT